MKPLALQMETVFWESSVGAISEDAYQQFADYLELLERWNARLSLTAITDRAEVVQRHFAECAFAAQHLPAGIASLLDYGSGAGFPGIPFAICLPSLQVTLAESNKKKVSFLREVVRSLGLKAEVFDGRVDAMPSDRLFDAVSLRAVENMEAALPVALLHAEKFLAVFTTHRLLARDQAASQVRGRRIRWRETVALPNSEQRVLSIAQIEAGADENVS